MAVTDLQIRGGGGAVIQTLRYDWGWRGAVSKTFFFSALRVSSWSKNKEATGPPYPSPGSASESDVTIGPLKRLCHEDIAPLG